MDLFDRLQDELLIHIISFLPTKYAVLTSALSTRWKFLWCYANNSLVLDDSVSFHNHQEDVGYYGLNVSDRVLPFTNFVDRVLKLNKRPQVENFYLKMYASQSRFNPIQSWLDDIVTRWQAKEIHVHFSLDLAVFHVDIPLETFHSASLRVLKLYLGIHRPLGVPSDDLKRLFLPNLKILHFWTNGICYKLWIFKYLFRASPQLEEAYFGGYLVTSKRFCNVYAPSLKRLRMIFRSVQPSNKFLINAPILEDLVIVDESFQQHVVKSNCLVNAKLDIGFPHVSKFQKLHVHIHRICKLLCRISHFMYLYLKAHTMDALSICCNSKYSSLPQFPALRRLKLRFLNYASWDVIPKLLECAPNLQVLVIIKDFKGNDAEFRRDSVWIQPSNIPVCLLSSLRQVQVSDCESHQVEFDLISYLLKHGDALSTFLIDLLPADSRDDLRFREKLMLIPKVSKTCELNVSVYPLCSERSSAPDEEKNRHLAKLRQLRTPAAKMCFDDLKVCTDYFSDSNLIIRTKKYKVYRGKLYQSSPFDPPVTDVVVKKWIIPAKRPYSKHKEDSMCSFREELKLLEHPNFKYHPYFMSLIGYCAEDYNERLGVVYNFRPLDCLKNLIPKDSFKWLQRMKVALVLACISEYMHNKQGDLPSVSPRLSPSSVILDEDYMPVLFNFNRRRRFFREKDQYDDNIGSLYNPSRGDADVLKFGLTLLGLISKRVHRCPHGRAHTLGCRTMFRWADMQQQDRYISSSLCKSDVPLVHKNLMDDSTYDIVDGLKITRLAMRCVDAPMQRPTMHGIIKYLCKLRVVRENWDVLDCDNIIRDHLTY